MQRPENSTARGWCYQTLNLVSQVSSINLEQFLNITPFPSQEILFRSPWSFKTFFLSTETMSLYNHVPALPQSTVLSRFMSTRTKP